MLFEKRTGSILKISMIYLRTRFTLFSLDEYWFYNHLWWWDIIWMLLSLLLFFSLLRNHFLLFPHPILQSLYFSLFSLTLSLSLSLSRSDTRRTKTPTPTHTHLIYARCLKIAFHIPMTCPTFVHMIWNFSSILLNILRVFSCQL